MVAASKLNKTMDAQRRARLFSDALDTMISRLAASVETLSHPLLSPRTHPKSAELLVVTSDKGLCGGYNNNLTRFVSRWLAMPAQKAKKFRLSFAGRRGHIYFRNRAPVRTYYEGVTDKPSEASAMRIGRDLIGCFESGEADELYLAFNKFISPLSQKPVIKKILPIESHELPPKGHALNDNFILEPDEHRLLELLLPQTIIVEVFFALLENAAGENGARMTAMDSATNNADKLITLYTLLRNRARQAAITKELIEIISGAEALHG
jgi:F-type H+-transporting ATPase subunit gamma